MVQVQAKVHTSADALASGNSAEATAESSDARIPSEVSSIRSQMPGVPKHQSRKSYPFIPVRPTEDPTRRVSRVGGSQRGGGGVRSVFAFNDLTFTVTLKKNGERKEKHIVRSVTGAVESGHVLAIMGPSGAGKTSFINTLTLKSFGGVCTGEVTLDGENLTPAILRERCYVVEQQDNHWSFLTCRETMLYAAELCMNQPKKDREELVSNLLKKMGLDSCEDTRVGNEFLQGLSGGQKRRLSIALALIKQPDVIFLDEPTSGLDAAAAANIMNFITDLAEAENLIVIATIHQPSTAVYNGFDEVMILSSGQVAYCGPADSGIEYFEGIGYKIPEFTNPAEFYLDLVNADFTAKEDVDRVIALWDEQGRSAFQIAPSVAEGRTAASRDPVALPKQIGIMLRRQSLLLFRDPMMYIGRCAIFLFSNIYFALVYLRTRERDQDQVLNKVWLCIWFIGVPANMGVVATFAYNIEYGAIKREVRNGMVSTTAYLVANTLLQLPIMLIFALCALGIGAYGIGNFYLTNFGGMILIYAAGLYAWECIAQVFSIFFPNPLLGMMVFLGTWFSGFLFGGFLIPEEDVFWPFKLFVYILPLRYTVRGMVYTEFIDSEWEDCSDVDRGEICYGEEGDEVLESLNSVFGLFSDEDTRTQDIGFCILIAVVLKLTFFAYITRLLGKATKISTKTS